MDFEDIAKPTLTEPGVKYFLHQSLKQCHIARETFNNMVFNFSLLFVFFLILGLILIYKYKGKLTPSEVNKKNKEKQQYILSKIKIFQDAKRTAQQELITGLPAWDNEHDILNAKSPY